jgi:RNA polymerase sigma-70 factor (ECF subfamily)
VCGHLPDDGTRRGEELQGVDDVDRRAVLDEWFRTYADRLLAYLLHRTDRETAQDVLQELFMTAYRKAPDVPEPPVGWLFATARRLLANKRRGLRRHDDLLARLADDVAATNDEPVAELKQAFAQTLAALSPGDREVLTLSGWYGLTPAEAAQALDCSPNAYNVRLHRARRRLSEHLTSAGYEAGTPAGQLAEALRG